MSRGATLPVAANDFEILKVGVWNPGLSLIVPPTNKIFTVVGGFTMIEDGFNFVGGL